MNDASGREFRFVIETPKPLSLNRILKYLVELEKLLGVPARLIRIERTDVAESPRVQVNAMKERQVPETAPNDQQNQADGNEIP